MSERFMAERVIEISGELQRLHVRLAELDQERASVHAEIQRLLMELGSAASATAPPAEIPAAPPPREPPPSPRPVEPPVPWLTRDKILTTINANPDKTFTASDFARIYEGRDAPTLMGFRAALSRLAAQRMIRRVKFGSYSALRSG